MLHSLQLKNFPMNSIKQLLLFLFLTAYGIHYAKSQVIGTLDSYLGKCCSRKIIKSATQHIRLFVVDSCMNNSYILDLKEIENGMFIKNGIAAYYYDTSFTKLKTLLYFNDGYLNGYIKQYYPSGNISFEGLCKTVKYFHSDNPKIMAKTLYNDTTFFPIQGKQTFDSLLNIEKVMLTDSALKNYYHNSSTKNLLFYTPYYQTQKFGEWVYYSKDGNVIKKENYRNGVLSKDE